MPEALGCESRCHIDVACGSIILIFGFGRRDVADGLEQPTMVEPVDPLEGGVFDRLEAAPRTASMDRLGFVEAIDHLGQSVEAPILSSGRRRRFLTAQMCKYLPDDVKCFRYESRDQASPTSWPPTISPDSLRRSAASRPTNTPPRCKRQSHTGSSSTRSTRCGD